MLRIKSTKNIKLALLENSTQTTFNVELSSYQRFLWSRTRPGHHHPLPLEERPDPPPWYTHLDLYFRNPYLPR